MELRDLKVGDFVRTKKGIAKIIDRILDPTHYYFKMWVTDTYLELNDDTEYICEKDIIKASDKLIDLVEEDDFINGYRVLEIMKNNRKKEPSTMVYCEFGNGFIGYYNEEIKTIVTKEMFEQMSYKVGE